MKSVCSLSSLRSWYLSVDFQFYVLAPLFVMAYLKHPILGFVAALAACLLSTFLLAYKTAQHGYSAMSFDGLWVTGECKECD